MLDCPDKVTGFYYAGGILFETEVGILGGVLG